MVASPETDCPGIDMSGLIRHIQVDDISLAPTQAELRLTITLDRD